MVKPRPPIDVLVNAPGSWASVRVQQPFAALQQLGWDVAIHTVPFTLHEAIRSNSLVIWQRPIATDWQQWLGCLQLIRQRGSLLLVEWDDDPELFPAGIRQRMERGDHAHLRIAHALHCSCPQLATALQRFHPHPLVVENGVHPIPACRPEKHSKASKLRVFLGNLNRIEEHRQLVPALQAWLDDTRDLTLVCVGPTGLDELLPHDRVERHELLPYNDYRKLLASCELALLPLQRSAEAACKTPIKWLEAAAESTVVVAGPELYQPWLAGNQNGLWASGVDQVVPLARQLASQPAWRRQLAIHSHAAAQAHALERQLVWRQELYRQLWRLRRRLDRRLLERWPQLARN